MANRSFISLGNSTPVIVRICVCILAVCFLFGGLAPSGEAGISWQLVVEPGAFDAGCEDGPEEDFINLGLNSLGFSELLTALPAYSVCRLARDPNPLFPPPRIQNPI